ncbi:MAG: hypothetical protein V4611_03350 [Patescibacteria group bacterium]
MTQTAETQAIDVALVTLRVMQFTRDFRHLAETHPMKRSRKRPRGKVKAISLDNGYYVVIDNGNEVIGSYFAGKMITCDVEAFLVSGDPAFVNGLFKLFDDRTEALS